MSLTTTMNEGMVWTIIFQEAHCSFQLCSTQVLTSSDVMCPWVWMVGQKISQLMSASYFHSWVTWGKKTDLRDVCHGDIVSGKLQYRVTNHPKPQQLKATITHYRSQPLQVIWGFTNLGWALLGQKCFQPVVFGEILLHEGGQLRWFSCRMKVQLAQIFPLWFL